MTLKTRFLQTNVWALSFAGLTGFASLGTVYAQNIAQFTTKSIANELINTPAIVHLVEPGDTLWMLSERYYGRALQWTDISYDNKIPVPKRLQPGTLLLLRAGGLGSANSAAVLAVTGDVRLLTPVVNAGMTALSKRSSGSKGQGHAGQAAMTFIAGNLINKGEIVPVGATLQTGPDSFITLRLPNGARATLPSNSQMKLVSFKDTKGKDAVLLDLTAGQVDARVPVSDDASGKPSYRVRTKLATIGARGTYFRVALPDPQRALVGVLEGTVAANWGFDKSLSDDGNRVKAAHSPVQQTNAASAALLTVGQGSVLQLAAANKQAVVQKLLPAPVLQEANAPQNQGEVAVRWLAVAGAAAYRLQLARDADFIDVVAQQDVPAQRQLQANDEDTSYKAWFPKLVQGNYFVRVSAVATDGLEGLFTLSAFTRQAYALSGAVASSANNEQLEFSWTALPNGNYWVEVASNETFTNVLLNVPNLTGNSLRVAALPPGQYYWRVRADVQEHGQTTSVVSDAMPMRVGGVR